MIDDYQIVMVALAVVDGPLKAIHPIDNYQIENLIEWPSG